MSYIEGLDSVEYKGYIVREDGLIVNSKTMKPIKHNIVINRNGRQYPKFHLYVDTRRELWFAHRLMAYLFYGPFELSEFKTMIVDHLDNDSMNYAIWNLQILGSHSENLQRRHQEYSEAPF